VVLDRVLEAIGVIVPARGYLEALTWLAAGVGYMFLIALAIALPLAVLLHALRRRPPPAEPRCRRCGYILIGLPEPRCPECATPFDPDAPAAATPPGLTFLQRWSIATGAIWALGAWALAGAFRPWSTPTLVVTIILAASYLPLSVVRGQVLPLRAFAIVAFVLACASAFHLRGGPAHGQIAFICLPPIAAILTALGQILMNTRRQ